MPVRNKVGPARNKPAGGSGKKQGSTQKQTSVPPPQQIPPPKQAPPPKKQAPSFTDHFKDWKTKFDAHPLPYHYVRVPQPEEPPNRPRREICYYVNNVITNLTRDTFKHAGFTCTTDARKWNASWGRQYSMEEYSRCENWQKVNHFAGAFLMGRKDNLHKRMMELKSRVGSFAPYYPESYLLPDQRSELEDRWQEYPTWIVKPSASSRGRGIHLLNSNESEPPTDPGIVQSYIFRPFLITGRKFDLRLYAFIPSIFPLRIYMHETGLARFCTHLYDPNGSPDDLHMHLTNFSVNKTDEAFIRSTSNEQQTIDDSKWSFDFWKNYMQSQGHDVSSLISDFEKLTITTIIAGMCEIRKTHSQMIPHRHTSYELYGIDIMLDAELKPNLIEINISPSLSGQDSKLDYDLKYPLNLDVLRMARIVECDPTSPNPCPSITLVDKHYTDSLSSDRVAKVEARELNPWDDPGFADFTMVRDYLEETSYQTGFRLVYPKPESFRQYEPCFDKMCYHDISFNAWMDMTDDKVRSEVLKKHWPKHQQELAELTDALFDG